jgi:hypothetical protein
MAGGGSFLSDQKFTTLTADGRFKTITGGSVNLGPCRVTYIMAHGGSDCLVKLHDGTDATGSLEFQAKFSSAGSVTLQDGNSVTQFQVDVPAGDVFAYNLAEDGIVFEGGMTVSALSAATVTVIIDK